MRAVVFAGEGQVRVDEVADPAVKGAGDAIVRVEITAICGSDLHVLDGKTPGMRVGGVIGHEFIGVVEDAGEDAGKLVGRKVLGSFLIACGRCDACRTRRFNHCSEGRALGVGTLFGDLDGAQAEIVRVPDALVNLIPLDGFAGIADEALMFCGDILATGIHAARVAGVAPGEEVAVFGAGPVGLCCSLAARDAGARVTVVDTDAARVEFARVRLGFDGSDAIEDGAVDIAVDAVGAIPALKAAMRAARDAGRVAVVGVYGAERYELPLGRVWNRELDLRFSGMANVQDCWEQALAAVSSGAIDPAPLVTHKLGLDDAPEGYELFRSREAMKVILRP
ncbi:MAG TPA: alcohol dehydrogenase catalytic domain-containing protein [Actinomycetota bacterium]|nr:alcohol dehydrogenase catalytic domain-containing protein [Actinomycetota bacterium]